MPPSLNLTPERGPSVWARMDRESRLDRWWLAMIVGGGVLAASSVRRSSSAPWAATLGLVCVTTGFLCHSGSKRVAAAFERLLRAEPVDNAIDRDSADSFPASDAPASSPAVGTVK
jgi:hypothetical protein